MPIKSYVMGPGTLTVGTAPLDVSCQVARCVVKVKENVKTTDPEPMLCGDDLETPDVVTLDYTLEATLVQDLSAAGIVAYSWDNKLTEQPFTFTPNTVEAATVDGAVRVVPLDVGGTPKERPKSDIAWAIIGDPEFTPGA